MNNVDEKLKKFWKSLTDVSLDDMSSATNLDFHIASTIINKIVETDSNFISFLDLDVYGEEMTDIPFMTLTDTGEDETHVGRRVVAFGTEYHNALGSDPELIIRWLAGFIHHTQNAYYVENVFCTTLNVKIFTQDDKNLNSPLDTYGWNIIHGKVIPSHFDAHGTRVTPGWV